MILHSVEEVKDAILDRTLEDLNKVVEEISEKTKDKSKDNEFTIGSQE